MCCTSFLDVSLFVHCCSNLSTIMDKWKLWFVLLLPLQLCFHTEESIVKTIGSEPDVTPICPAATLHMITLIVCKIRTETRGECRLLYKYGHKFVHECDSRFRLTTVNQTVFLHLTSLTTEDSGSYTCECSHVRGTDILQLIITVKGDEDQSTKLIYTAVIGCATALIIVTAVVLGFILKNCYYRDDTKSGTSGLDICEPPGSLDNDDPDKPDASIQQPASDLYVPMSKLHHHHISKNVTIPLVEQETGGQETGLIYENL